MVMAALRGLGASLPARAAKILVSELLPPQSAAAAAADICMIMQKLEDLAVVLVEMLALSVVPLVRLVHQYKVKKVEIVPTTEALAAAVALGRREQLVIPGVQEKEAKVEME